MEGESGVTRSILDELHSSDIQEDQMTDENSVTGSIIVEFLFSDNLGYQMEGESGVTRGIIDELDPSDVQRDQMVG